MKAARTHKQGHKQIDNRPSAHRRGYTKNWQKAKNNYLARNPLCAECEARGIIKPATVVDHIIPHKGDQKLFWDEDNWQSLCKPHHDKKTGEGE